jgi:signal transduction histidine kinase
MKTPLAVINLQLQDYEGEEIFLEIGQELDKLDKGLNLAMNFARLEEFQNDFVIEKINLYDEIMIILNKEKRLFIKNRIIPKVDLNEELKVYTDKKWIKFVIEQVIINGVKYSKNYGKYLNLKSRESSEYIILDIIDEGIGICKKDIKRVFDPFFTGENGRKYGETTGMGLYIAKKVCDNLGHIIEIKSEVESGTQISILFKK